MGTTNTLKISYSIFNVILALFAMSVIAYTSANSQEDTAVIVFIICGLMVTFAGLGGFAAIRESMCLTATCATFLFLLIALQIAALCYYASIFKRIGYEIVDIVWLDPPMNDIEIEYKCCGKTGAEDYVLINKSIPLSCYTFHEIADPILLYHDGCSAKLQDYYDREMFAYWIGNGFLIVFEAIGFLLAIFLFISFRNKQRRS